EPPQGFLVELQMIRDPQPHLAPTLEDGARPGVGRHRGLVSAAEFREIAQDQLRVLVLDAEQAPVGMAPPGEKIAGALYRRTRIQNHCIAFITPAAAGAASIICCICPAWARAARTCMTP